MPHFLAFLFLHLLLAILCRLGFALLLAGSAPFRRKRGQRCRRVAVLLVVLPVFDLVLSAAVTNAFTTCAPLHTRVEAFQAAPGPAALTHMRAFLH